MVTGTFNTGAGSGSGGSPGNQIPLTMGSPLAQNQHLSSSATKAEYETKPEPELCQLEAELRWMREENDCLIQEIRMQQLVSERNDMIYPMMLQQQQQNRGESVPVGEYKIGGCVGGLQTASVSVDAAGGSLGFPAAASSTITTQAAATGGGKNINSATSAVTEMRAGVMGIQRSMNTMMMPNSIMIDGNGVSDMNSNSSLSVPCTSSLKDPYPYLAASARPVENVAGGSLGFPSIAASTTTATATREVSKNSASTIMMGMNSSMNTMMMPNSVMVDGNGMSDIMNLNSSVSVPCTSSLTDSFTSMTGISSGCNSTSTAAASYASDNTQPISNVSHADEMLDAEEQEVQASDEPNWERRYRELVQYKSEHGHTRVPARWKSNPQLGRWVMTQRRQFTILIQGHPSPLTADRMSRLNEIGFQWALRADKITMWNRMFSELKAFKEEFGNCVVPQRYPANPKLGTWVHTQRRQYKLMLEGKKSAMNEEKIAALDSLGFTWVAKTNGWSMYES